MVTLNAVGELHGGSRRVGQGYERLTVSIPAHRAIPEGDPEVTTKGPAIIRHSAILPLGPHLQRGTAREARGPPTYTEARQGEAPYGEADLEVPGPPLLRGQDPSLTG